MNSKQTRKLQDTQPADPMRRTVVGGLVGALGLAACSQGDQANAQEGGTKGEKKEKVFNAYNRKKTFSNGEMDAGTPWTASQTGNFDIEDPRQNKLAVLKLTNNLVGSRTYVPMLTRQLIAREDLPGGLLLGAASMFTWQLQVPDPEEFGEVPEGTALMRSMFTSVYLDPHTMEPVKNLKNPYNGKSMELEDYIFVENFLSFPMGGSRFVEERQFSDDDPNEPKPRLIKKWGDQLVLFSGGVYSKPGKHQPRFTENTWRAPYAEVMDPDVSLINTGYNFMGVNKAFEKPWAGYTEGETDSLMSLATGQKVHSPEDLPDFHKRVIAERFPDRL
ncbi:MAG: hypothetical protein AAF736_13775 [Pseudomonadota bacterium]